MGSQIPDWVEAFWLWMKPLMDLYDHGERTKSGVPRVNTNDQLVAFGKGCRYHKGRFIQCLRKKDFVRHVLQPHFLTLYYGPSRRSDLWLICLDIDAHQGQEDALAVVQYLIANFFAGAYFEPSTNGRGYHLYVLVSGIQYVKRAELNERIEGLAEALRSILVAKGFRSKLCDIFGTFTVCDEAAFHRGTCAKIPRLPHGQESLDWLLGAHHVPWNRLDSMVDQFELCGQINGLPGAGLDTVLEDRGGPVGTPAEPSVSSGVGNRARLKMHDPSAWTRTHYSVMALAQDLRRLPSFEEWHAFYLAHSLNTGEDELNRRPKRFEDAIELVGKTFSPELAGAGGYRVGEYLDLIKRLVPPAELDTAAVDAKFRTAKRKKRLTYEDLDIGLGFHTQETLTRREGHKPFTVAEDRMIGFFRQLKQDGKSDRSCDYGKLRAIRLALSRAGLIVCLDPSYRVGNPRAGIQGRAQRWGLGENHPRYGDFALAQEQLKLASRSGYVGWSEVR